jgi:ABC-type proline/glycine betaine transport system permease subunit
VSVVATILVGLGAIFDTTPEVHLFWLALHVIGFFALDAIFIDFLVGLFHDLRAKTDACHSLPYWLAFISGFSLEFAALMGHAAG